MSARSSIFVLVAIVAIVAIAACSDASPLSSTERRALGGFIYFVSERDSDSSAWRVRPDGSGEALVLRGADASYPYGASKDKSSVTFVISKGELDAIIIADADGKNSRPLAADDRGLSWYPTYSPDGEWILFESSRDDFRELYKVSARGGEAVRLTNNHEGNFDGAWSPDGKKIAFASSRFGQLDLFVMDADGSNQRRLTQHPGDAVKPAWSSDGSLIAFISARDGRDNLFAVAPDGTNIQNLTPGQDEVESFVWQPGQKRIVYAARAADRKSRLRAVELSSGAASVSELGGKDDNDSNPAWSPDGRHLVFASSIEGKSDLWIARADGSQRTRLTHDPRGAWLPRWLDVNGEEK